MTDKKEDNRISISKTTEEISIMPYTQSAGKLWLPADKVILKEDVKKAIENYLYVLESVTEEFDQFCDCDEYDDHEYHHDDCQTSKMRKDADNLRELKL